MTLLDGPDRIDLYHFGAGHTDGDTIVVFPALRVAHTGDLFARPATPLIDLNNGGSGVAYPDNDPKSRRRDHRRSGTVIPGHTPTTTTRGQRLSSSGNSTRRSWPRYPQR